MDQIGHILRKLHRRAERRASQPVIDVVCRFVGIQRQQMIADRDPLAELLEFRGGQLVAQIGLSDERNLEEFRFLGFQIGQHPQFFERAGAQILGFIDDEQHEPAR